MSNIVVILIHGYNVSDPRNTVGKFRREVEKFGHTAELYSYGYWPFPWQITKRNPKFAREIAGRIRYWKGKGYRVYLIAHSNGNTIARICEKVHKQYADRILAIHPALRKTMEISEFAEKVYVVHNKGDKAVVAGKVLGWFTKVLSMDSWRFRPWGDMGQDGYNGGRVNHFNIDTGSNKLPPMLRCHGHSEEFHENVAHYWLPYLTDKLLGRK